MALAPDGRPVGFALASLVDGSAHLLELDVHPDHGRRGIGARLVRAVLAWARERGHASVTLTTFAHLPFNAPFYARLGFRRLEKGELAPELGAILAKEIEDEGPNRIAMRCVLERSRSEAPSG